jgi:LCP family protein required for cell wall assembly
MRSKRRIFAYGALSLALLAAVGAAFAYYKLQALVDDFQSGAKAALVRSALPQLDIQPAHPLPGMASSQVFLVLGTDDAGGNSDTIMLVRIDPHDHTASILSLPRDLYVSIPGHGMAKINAAYPDGGPGLLIETIRDLTGVGINHYVQVNFGGFKQLVEDLGGVYLPIDQSYEHTSSPEPEENWNSIHLQPGYQLLGGSGALQWVRFRHLDTDFLRVARQQIFLSAVFQQVRRQVTDLTQSYTILHDLARATASDIHSVPELLSIGDTLRQTAPDRIARVTMQAEAFTLEGIDYERASQRQRRAAIEAWAYPGRALSRDHLTASAPQPSHGAGQGASGLSTSLTSDGGEGHSLLAPFAHRLSLCAPSELPTGFSWGTPDTAHTYSLDGHPAVAAWATEGSGDSVLWMWSTWQDPPILDAPSQTVKRGRRQYEIYFDSGHVREVAWMVGGTRAWVTNTLQDDLSDQQMLALAEGCQPLA